MSTESSALGGSPTSTINGSSQTLTSSSDFPGRTSGQGGGGGGNPNQFGGSTASNLYLYTFLATLVLLLLVSGAVVARSISLRVRARRAIEESIRNGTYVPPPPRDGAAGAPKPVLFDARIDEKDEKSTHWENLVPVAASFIPGKTSRTLPRPATSAPTARPNNSLYHRLRSSNLNPFRTVHIQDILDELASRDLHSRIAVPQAPQPTQAELADAVYGTAPTAEGNNDKAEIEHPTAVRVAVLIAMPDPTRPSNGVSHDKSHSNSSSSTSSVKSRGASSGQDSEELELPYVEFGVTTVPFVPSSPPVIIPSARPDTPT